MFVMFVDETPYEGNPMVHAVDKISSMWIDGGFLKVQEQGRPASESTPYDFQQICNRYSEAEVLTGIAGCMDKDNPRSVVQITVDYIARICWASRPTDLHS